MSIRHLDSLLQPESVAVIGASDRAGSLGAIAWRNLCQGGFPGVVYAVNRNHATVGGTPAWPSVAALPQAPGLALICTPPAGVAALVRQLGARGTPAAVVMTAGLTAAQKKAVLTAARKHKLRVLGPGSVGLLAPHHGLNASLAQQPAAPGTLALVAQSGALAHVMLDWAQHRGLGFSHVVTLGEQADVDFGDLLDHLGSDPQTQAILLCIEDIRAPRRFMSAARLAARNKPVVVLKAGRHTQGPQAGVESGREDAAALIDSDLVLDAAIRRAGMLRVDTLQDLFTAAATLAHFRAAPLRGLDEDARAALGRLTIVSNGSAAGALAADAAARAGVELAAPLAATLRTLRPALHASGSRTNPLELHGNAPLESYALVLKTLLADTSTGTLLFLHAPSAMVSSADIAAALLPLIQAAPDPPQRLLACWMGGPSAPAARTAFQDAGIPCHDTPEAAVRGLAMLRDHRQQQALLLEAPPATGTPPGPDLPTVRATVAGVLAAGRDWLNDAEAQAVLRACGVPVAGMQMPAGVEDAGSGIKQMQHRPDALALRVGARVDPLFGPVILFGHGGTATHEAADLAVALPPLNLPLAHALVARTRVGRQLAGGPGAPAAGMAAAVAALSGVSALLTEVAQVAELHIAPFLVDATGVVAMQARIRVSAQAGGGGAAFAIRPYPTELEQTAAWRDGTVVLRPIRPEDEAQHLEFLGRLDPADIRMRVFYSRRSIERTELARLAQIDYEREMAFIATAPGPTGTEETLGVVRAVTDPDNIGADFGIVVRSDLKGTGLGRLLMGKLLDYLRQRGTQRLHATVLKENTAMLSMMQALGFQPDEEQPADDTQTLSRPLTPPQA